MIPNLRRYDWRCRVWGPKYAPVPYLTRFGGTEGVGGCLWVAENPFRIIRIWGAKGFKGERAPATEQEIQVSANQQRLSDLIGPYTGVPIG